MPEIVSRLNAALERRYRVEREIGRGGMATVYVAQDLRHHRAVALKVLKPELAAVVGAERFLAEIRTTANLRHPHILPLFDSGEAGGFLYYAMPYLEGESLRSRLDRERQLPVVEAVAIASKVAAALQHAHAHGVIHRDIKPGNIVLQDGEPVVVDFGIALAVGVAGGGRLTETGLSLGTPFYMSPEQATGDQEVGPATDIYALGCVLYEMLVGDPPYSGSTAQAVLGKIIQGLPVSANAARRSVPPNVDAAIRTALEKLPADRFHDAQSFARALGDSSFRHGSGGYVEAARARALWNPLSVASTALAAVLAMGLAWSLLRPAEPPPTSRQVLSTDGWAGLAPNFGRRAALAPDGSSMVLPIEGNRLGLKLRGSTEVAPIPGTEGARDVHYSPDSQWILFVTGTRLMKRPLVGGAPVTLAEDADPNIAASAWLDDGTIIYEQVIPGAERPQRLLRVSENGGEPLAVVFGDAEGPVLPQWVHALPGGRGLLVTACPGVTGCLTENANLHVVDLRDGASRLVLEQVVRAWHTPTGHVVYLRADGALFAAPFDVDALEVTGGSIPLMEGVRFSGAPLASPEILLGMEGTLLVTEGEVPRDAVRELVWVDRSGREEPVDAGMTGQLFTSLALSPGDDRLAVSIVVAAPSELWLKELPDGPLTRLTTDPGETRRPAWSADGSTIAYITQDPGAPPHARTVRADGGSVGAYEVLLEREEAVLEVLFTPDGGALVFRTGDVGQGEADLGFVDLATGAVDEELLASDFNESAIDVSPDGRWLAYVSDLTGRPEVFVRPLASSQGGRRQVSTNGGFEPLWAANGREIFYREPVGGSMLVASYETDPTFSIEGRARLFDATPYALVNGWRGYDVSRDAQRFVMIRPDEVPDAGSSRLILVQNWFTELQERTRASR